MVSRIGSIEKILCSGTIAQEFFLRPRTRGHGCSAAAIPESDETAAGPDSGPVSAANPGVRADRTEIPDRRGTAPDPASGTMKPRARARASRVPAGPGRRGRCRRKGHAKIAAVRAGNRYRGSGRPARRCEVPSGRRAVSPPSFFPFTGRRRPNGAASRIAAANPAGAVFQVRSAGFSRYTEPVSRISREEAPMRISNVPVSQCQRPNETL